MEGEKTGHVARLPVGRDPRFVHALNIRNKELGRGVVRKETADTRPGEKFLAGGSGEKLLPWGGRKRGEGIGGKMTTVVWMAGGR